MVPPSVGVRSSVGAQSCDAVSLVGSAMASCSSYTVPKARRHMKLLVLAFARPTRRLFAGADSSTEYYHNGGGAETVRDRPGGSHSYPLP